MSHRQWSLGTRAAVNNRHLRQTEQLKPSEAVANEESEDLRDKVEAGDGKGVNWKLFCCVAAAGTVLEQLLVMVRRCRTERKDGDLELDHKKKTDTLYTGHKYHLSPLK